MIVGTAGHIDHGKSALVKRLTGVDPDRLKEEKARGITIDLGFAYWPRPDGQVVGFVDVPGHEGLVHNMLAGATGIDFVMLVVAADDGVMPQTREHLAIMDLLGLKRGLVALNKADLVTSDRLAAVETQLVDAMAGTGLEGSEILPVSAMTGEGLAELADRLDRARLRASEKNAGGAFRLFIDRVFSLTGQGTVVTGTIASGMVQVDDTIVVSPTGLTARVRSIHAQNRPVTRGVAGQRCALVLAGSGISTASVRRGDACVAPHLHEPASRIDVQLRVLASERKPVGQWMPMRFHHGAAEVGGRIVPLSDETIAPGTVGLAQLVLERPVAAAAMDRFIVRETSARRTLGGGVALDLRAPERRRRTPERLAELLLLSEPDPAACLSRLLEGPLTTCDIGAFVRDRGLPRASTQELMRHLDLVALPAGEATMVMTSAKWRTFRSSICAKVDEHHAANPEHMGVPMESLRKQVAPKLRPLLFASALQRLASENAIALDRAFVRRRSHGINLSAQDAGTWSRIRQLLAGADRFRPPRVRDLVAMVGRDEVVIRRLMQLSAKRGETEEIAKDHFFLAETVAEMAEIARQIDGSPGAAGISAAAFRDRLDNGRKVAIQILEFFDRRGFTIRRGDERRINPHKADLFRKT